MRPTGVLLLGMALVLGACGKEDIPIKPVEPPVNVLGEGQRISLTPEETARVERTNKINQAVQPQRVQVVAKATFWDELRLKKATNEQVVAYTQCAHEEFSKSVGEAFFAEMLSYLRVQARHIKSKTRMSSQESARFAEFEKKFLEKTSKAEETCTDRLGVNLPRGKVLQLLKAQ